MRSSLLFALPIKTVNSSVLLTRRFLTSSFKLFIIAFSWALMLILCDRLVEVFLLGSSAIGSCSGGIFLVESYLGA